jgi:PAS domain S-box-containing protein
MVRDVSDVNLRGSAIGNDGPPAESELAFARASILLVDDQPARLLSYEAILSGLRVRCVRALSGTEALAKLMQQQEFAAILLDVNMPGMDGFEVARLVRAHPRLGQTPIVFITGVHVTEFDQLKGYEVGAIDYISVPVVPDILRSKIAILVELHQRRSELEALNLELQEARRKLEIDHSKALAERDAQLRAVSERPVDDRGSRASGARGGERQIAEPHVREDAEWFRLIAETIPQLVWSARADGFSDYYNGRFLTYLGLSLEEMDGSTWVTTLHPDDVAGSAAAWNRAVATGEDYAVEARIQQGREGPYRWHSIRGVPLRDSTGRVLRWFGTCTDVEDRRRAEQAHLESERRHRAVIEDAPVGVCYCGMNGQFQYANAAFCRLVGYTAAGV